MARRLVASFALLGLLVGFAACNGPGAGGSGAEVSASDSAPRVTLDTQEAKTKLGEDDGFDVAIFYGAELMGSIDDCGCPSHPEGGLPWRYGYTEGFRNAYEGAGFLQVDAGHSMADVINVKNELYPDQTAKNDWVLKAFGQLGFDAVNVSHHEIYYLQKFLRKGVYEQAVADSPILARFVSANLKPATSANGQPLNPDLVAPPPYVVREAKGDRIPGGVKRFAIIGLTENNPALPQQTGFGVVSASKALAEVLPKAKSESDLVVVLFYGSPEEAQALAEGSQGQIDLMVVAHPRARESEPKMDGPTKIVYARYQTRKLGEARLTFENDKLAGMTTRYITLDDQLPKDPVAEQMAAEAKEAIKKAQIERFNSVPGAVDTNTNEKAGGA